MIPDVSSTVHYQPRPERSDSQCFDAHVTAVRPNDKTGVTRLILAFFAPGSPAVGVATVFEADDRWHDPRDCPRRRDPR